MKIKPVLFGSIVLINLCGVLPLQAEPVTIGAGVAVAVKPYKGDRTEVLPFPYIHYDSERFFIKGSGIGLHLVNSGSHQLDIKLDYLELNFDASDSSDEAMQKLDDRRSTVLGGIGYTYRIHDLAFFGSVSVDLLDQSNTVMINAGASYTFRPASHLTVIPSVGVIWANKKHNDYYYGVSQKESIRSRLRAYDAKDTLSPYIAVSTHYQLTSTWSIMAHAHYQYLPDRIKDSPMVSNCSTGSIMLGVGYRFK